MKNPFAWLATEITTRPLAVAGVAAIVFLVMIFGLTLVSMETGTDTYLDKDFPPRGPARPLYRYLRLKCPDAHL